MTIYRSKTGPELIIPIGLLTGSVALVMAYNKVWAGLSIIALLLLFILHLFLTTYYRIEGTLLKIKCGFLFTKSIDISTISRIAETNNPLSSPATSLDRLEIIYNRFERIMISPKDKKGFISHVKSIKPEIEVQLKQK